MKRRALFYCLIGIGLMALPSVRSQMRKDSHLLELSAGEPAAPEGGILYTVNTTSDTVIAGACANGGAGCSLRGAIQAANSHLGNDGIDISIPASDPFCSGGSCTINLTQALPDISTNMLITGPGPSGLTVRPGTGGNFRVFVVTAGAVAFSGLTISNGSAPFQESGGGIFNSGSGTVNVTNCTISGNMNMGGDAGGIANFGTLSVTNSTISGNQAHYLGGGITNFGTLNVTNSTISGNVAEIGGGIFVASSGIMNVTNSTISGNFGTVGSGQGGGIYVAAGAPNVKSCIIARNTVTGSGPDVIGNFVSAGFNLIGKTDGSAGFTAATDQTGTVALPLDPKLDPNGLQDNGGPTQTIALLPGSPALDKGTSNGLTGQLTTDQRGTGFPRTFNNPAIPNAVGGDGTNIGAFEERSTRGDFNGDSFTDYLLFNSSTRRTAIWNLRNNAFLGSTFGPTLPVGWVVVCVADVNRDSKQDYVLFNASARRTAVWFLNNATLLSSAFGPTLPPGWTLIAAVDINNDGKPDYVLFNASTRRTAIWFLNGTALTGTASGPALSAGWMLVDALDFNSDNKPDFVLSNSSTRQTAIWYLSGTVRTASAFGPTLPSGWMLQGAADFNSDGKPDYVLFEASTRRTALWYLNGATFAGSVFGPTLAAGYSLVSP